MKMFAKHSSYVHFITVLIPFFLVFMGMKVPDFTHPHKPKPMRRAVLDKTPAYTVIQSIVKADSDNCCVSSLPLLFVVTTKIYTTEAPPIFSPVPFLSLSPFPPRAPPVSTKIA
jgi:hypothetical protein